MRLRPIVLALLASCIAYALPASAHDVRGTAIYLDMGRGAVGVELHAPLSQLQLALAGEAPAAYIKAHLHASAADGTPLAFRPLEVATSGSGEAAELIARGELRPAHATDLRRFELRYDAILERVVTHNVYVFVRRDLWTGQLGPEPQLAGLLHWQRRALVIDRRDGSALRALGATLGLGARHIAEGTDHLMFLLMLLLPAPLAAAAGAWRERLPARSSLWAIAKLVSAFTAGHTLTLAASSLRWLALPVRPVEVAIAASIVISAVHALHPIFFRREAWLAMLFGLIHGLGFASALRDFGFDAGSLLLALLGFNLGIELMQLALVLCVAPLLLLAARRGGYSWLRVGGATLGIALGLLWIGQRALGLG